MSTEDLIKTLKNAATADKLELVLKLMKENLNKFSDSLVETELIQTSARLSSITREKALGIITFEQYNIERNQLRFLLIEKIVALEKNIQEKAQVEGFDEIQDGDLLIEEASKLFNSQKFREAEIVIKKALGSTFVRYDLAEAYALLGHIYDKLNYFQDAIEAHQKSLEINPHSAEYWTNLGVVYRLTAQYQKAEECYLKALKIAPEYAELHASLGALQLTHTMDFDKAIFHLEKAISLDPGLAIAYSNMAIAQASIGNFSEADRYLRLAVLKGYTNAESARRMIDNLRKLSH